MKFFYSLLAFLITFFILPLDSFAVTYAPYPFGDEHWKPPVATAASLPATTNVTGDARIALDTLDIYVWNGSAWISNTAGLTALTGDVTANGPGSVAATVNSVGGSTASNVHLAELLANAGTNLNTASTLVKRDASGNFNIGTITGALSGNATNITGNLAFAQSPSTPVFKMLEVDHLRTDSYTADGSPQRPYKTIMAAVNKIIANGDNADTVPYVVYISGTGVYTETVSLNDTHLVNVSLMAKSAHTVTIQATPAITSTSNNANLDYFILTGIDTIGDVDFESSTPNAGPFSGGANFINSSVVGNFTLKSVWSPVALDFQVFGDITLENINSGVLYHTIQGSGAFSLTTNLAHNIPTSGFTNSIMTLDAGVYVADPITVDAASIFQTRGGARIGASGGTMTVGGTYTGYPGFIRSNLVFSGGSTFLNRGVMWGGTLSMNGSETDIANFNAASLKTPTLTLGGTAISNAPAGYMSLSTGSLVGIVANEIVGSGKTVRAQTIENLVASATTFTCASNPTFSLYDCGTSTGACTAGTILLGSVVISAVNTITDGTISSANIAAGHYWAWEITAGTCTALTVNGSAEFKMQ